MTQTLTEKLADALRDLYNHLPFDEIRTERAKRAREALVEYRLKYEPPTITDEQIQELGERFGWGVSNRTTGVFIWCDGDPSELIRAALAEYGR